MLSDDLRDCRAGCTRRHPPKGHWSGRPRRPVSGSEAPLTNVLLPPTNGEISSGGRRHGRAVRRTSADADSQCRRRRWQAKPQAEGPVGVVDHPSHPIVAGSIPVGRAFRTGGNSIRTCRRGPLRGLRPHLVRTSRAGCQIEVHRDDAEVIPEETRVHVRGVGPGKRGGQLGWTAANVGGRLRLLAGSLGRPARRQSCSGQSWRHGRRPTRGACRAVAGRSGRCSPQSWACRWRRVATRAGGRHRH